MDQQTPPPEARAAAQPPPEQVPLLQRLYDRPFLLLAAGFLVMAILFTAWGLWEVMSLPQATLP
ncbi:MAG: hypothetical protein D6701_05870 [Gemmatimonadetes bacterium]|nr:MAG: hypothetical protein D6701_05870 [Gemmatimonadota bacterium]